MIPEEIIKNATTSIYGHNKYQLEILELKQKIEDMNSIIKIKDDELILFKNNMMDFQLELQNKNQTISEISDKLNNTIDNLNNTKTQLRDSISDSSDNIIIHDNQILLLTTENKELHKNIINANITNNDLLLKYNDLKLTYQNTLNILEKKTCEKTDIDSLYLNILQELNLYKELNLTLQENINIIKIELVNSTNNINHLQSLIYEKDMYLKDLNKKYAYETPIIVNETYPETDFPIQTPQPFIKTQRGIKISRK